MGNNPSILLDHQKIKSLLHHNAILEVFETINSTNDYIKCSADIQICLAEQQTQGRGQRDKTWYSPFAQNIYLSLRYPLPKNISGLSLVIGLAICQTVAPYLIQDKLKVKWPNDVLVNHAKLAGTLIEIQGSSIIIGIGLNVNMTESPVDQAWTSLRKLTGQDHDRNSLCAALINHVIDYLITFSQQGLNAFMDEWKSRDNLYNQAISMLSNNIHYQGVGAGINEQGHLLLKTADEKVLAFPSGTVHYFK